MGQHRNDFCPGTPIEVEYVLAEPGVGTLLDTDRRSLMDVLDSKFIEEDFSGSYEVKETAETYKSAPEIDSPREKYQPAPHIHGVNGGIAATGANLDPDCSRCCPPNARPEPQDVTSAPEISRPVLDACGHVEHIGHDKRIGLIRSHDGRARWVPCPEPGGGE